MNLSSNVRDAGGIYKRYSSRLEKLGIVKFEDFLYHIPFRYDDFSIVSKISEIQEGEVVTIQGKVLSIKNIFTRSYKKIQKAIVEDDSGTIEITWFNQPYLTRMIAPGNTISLSGKVSRNLNALGLISPDFEILNEDGKNLHTGRLVPVYPETAGISSKWLRRQVDMLLSNNLSEIEDFIPEQMLKTNSLLELQSAIKEVHFPNSLEKAQRARDRLSFDELLIIQTASQVRKNEWKNKLTGQKLKLFESKTEELIKSLPFELTDDQNNAISEIFGDLSSQTPMNRLLEGDVGSGKTVVAAISAYNVFLNGFQTAVIAPTEVLANQHYKTFNDLLSRIGVKVELVTGSNKLKTSDFDILIGTHAIINEKVKFKNLAFVVVDEQQRFGVEQRSAIRNKGKNPHFLTMTATPIPRTVALALYGDLDLTLISQMPKERKIVKTWVVPENKRTNAYSWIEKEIKTTKSQAFIICPFIEESESMTTVKAAKKEFEYLSKEVFKNLRLSLLHGKMKSKERQVELDKFKSGEIDILVATPIVEVGIDVPNATIIVIEAADKFGLAQLHQLRGRVGRGDKQSYCLLFAQTGSETISKRLNAMETIHQGARLAEIDLEIRGSGEIFGTAQHGNSFLKIAEFSNFELVDRTKKEAQKLVSEIDRYPKLLEKIQKINNQNVSPD